MLQRGYFLLKTTTVCCGCMSQHLRCYREAIFYLRQPQFVVDVWHTIWDVTERLFLLKTATVCCVCMTQFEMLQIGYFLLKTATVCCGCMTQFEMLQRGYEDSKWINRWLITWLKNNNFWKVTERLFIAREDDRLLWKKRTISERSHRGLDHNIWEVTAKGCPGFVVEFNA